MGGGDDAEGGALVAKAAVESHIAAVVREESTRLHPAPASPASPDAGAKKLGRSRARARLRRGARTASRPSSRASTTGSWASPLASLSLIAFVGVEYIARFAVVFLAGVVLSVLSIWAGVVTAAAGQDKPNQGVVGFGPAAVQLVATRWR
ncbi:potassium:chloride symporter [Aureococcus anophagefferens]|nr:potassium:chloride symporter [Aureococcus anophagefferens]